MNAQYYVNRRIFVGLLSDAYEVAEAVKSIDYTKTSDPDVELIHIAYRDGRVHRINVSGLSNIEIGLEIAKQLSGTDADGLIR